MTVSNFRKLTDSEGFTAGLGLGDNSVSVQAAITKVDRMVA